MFPFFSVLIVLLCYLCIRSFVHVAVVAFLLDWQILVVYDCERRLWRVPIKIMDTMYYQGKRNIPSPYCSKTKLVLDFEHRMPRQRWFDQSTFFLNSCTSSSLWRFTTIISKQLSMIDIIQ